MLVLLRPVPAVSSRCLGGLCVEIEHRLSDVLSEFARTLVTDFPIQAILDHLVMRIVDVLPISAAGVTLIAPGTVPRYVAASGESALRFERLQTDLGEGPCIEAYETGEAVAVPDLRVDDRFPTFAARARLAGLVAVFTFPLRDGDHQLGALDLYRTSAGPMNDTEMAAAQTLADVTAAYLQNAQARVDLKESSELARENSLHDALTGLPNRATARAASRARDPAVPPLGQDGGDPVRGPGQVQVGERHLRAPRRGRAAHRRRSPAHRVAAPGDTLARMAGDEFVVLCEDLDHAEQVEPVAARIGAALNEPFALSSVSVRVTASVGIAFAGRGDEVPEQVLRDADTAMYQVKRSGGARHAVVDLRAQTSENQRIDLSRDLTDAVGREQLRTEYQPIVATTDGRVIGVEACSAGRTPPSGSSGRRRRSRWPSRPG